MVSKLPVSRFSARTLPGLLASTCRRVPERTFLYYLDPAKPASPAVKITFVEFRAKVMQAASFLKASGIQPGDRVLLLAENSPEWQAMSLAAQLLRAEPVAIFASLAGPQTAEIVGRIRPRLVFVSSAAQWSKLADVAGELGLTKIVSAEALKPETVPPGVLTVSFAEIFGPEAPAMDISEFETRATGIREEDPFLLLFTSGTTGRPKGVPLVQRSIVHAIDAGGPPTGITEKDLGIHLLPFGHIAGHDQFALALAQGHSIVMVVRREDMKRAFALSPNYIFSVPNLYEKIRRLALESMNQKPQPLRGVLKASLAAAARLRVAERPRFGDRALTGLADLTIGRKVRKAMGGRVRGLFIGGAPAPATLFSFFESLGIPVIEFYGMSETAGMISSNLFYGRRKPGISGLISPDHEVRIDEDGELLLRGPLIFGSYIDPKDNQNAFTKDGFFRTGDRVQIDADGCLRIIGRKKHLMVLSTGKKIAPEPIEATIASAPPFQGAVLVGEGRPFVSIIVFVRQEDLNRLSTAGQDPSETLLAQARAALNDFSDFEKPKKLLVLPGELQDYPALITPTLKVRREALLRFLESSVSGLYGSRSSQAA